MPERGPLPERYLAPCQIIEGFEPVALAHHDVLAGPMGGNGKGDHPFARLGDGDVGRDEVALAGDQGANECVPALHPHPVDVEIVLLGEAENQVAMELRRVGEDAAGVVDLRVMAWNDDGEGSSRCNQLEG